jgi:hypothetical protein
MGGIAPYGFDEALKLRHLGGPQHPILSELLDTDGDGDGTTNMATTADVYFTQPPAGQLYVINTIDILIADDGLLDVDGWGSLVALTTGCKLDITRAETATITPYSVHDFTAGVALKHHGHLARLGDISFTDSALGCLVQVHLNDIPTFRLDGDRGEALVLETQDNLSGLVSMEVKIHGHIFFSKG